MILEIIKEYPDSLPKGIHIVEKEKHTFYFEDIYVGKNLHLAKYKKYFKPVDNELHSDQKEGLLP